eukprot:15718010-Heterocapsa_arctica.AAC.1
MLDSGAFTHVCPVTFAPQAPINYTQPHPGGIMANGQPLTCRGTKVVRLNLWSGEALELKFA